jgi:hypothetical protein
MLYPVLADLVALTHLGFIVFVLFGGLMALRWRWAVWVHLPAMAWGAVVEFWGLFCPLTPLENSLRRAGGAAGYSGGFVEEYLLPVIYPGQLTREIQFVLGAIVVLVNLVVYTIVFRRRHRAGARSTERDEF